MNYIEFDPINPDVFENFVSKRERKESLFSNLILFGITFLVIYLVKKHEVEGNNRIRFDL